MLVHAVAGVDDGAADPAAGQVGCPGRRVPEDDRVGAQGLQSLHGINEGLTLLDAAAFYIAANDLRTQPLRGEFEGDLGAGTRLVEERYHGAALQRVRPPLTIG